MSILKAALGFVATAYVNDAVLKPRSVGQMARAYCDRVRRPLLLVRGERIVDLLMGDPVKADVTTRRAYPLPYRSGHFGAVVAVNVLERLERPDLALEEWRRVADKVFVLVPSWWAPHSWLDPGKRWLVHPDLSRAAPLWTSRRNIYLLQVSDRRYGGQRWSPKRPQAPRTPAPTTPPSERSSRPEAGPSPSEYPSPSEHPSLPDPSPSPSPSSGSSESSELSSSRFYSDTPSMSELPDMDDVTLSDLQSPGLGRAPSSSSSSPRVLTVVSTPESIDD